MSEQDISIQNFIIDHKVQAEKVFPAINLENKNSQALGYNF